MTQDFFSLIEKWDGKGVVVRHDRPTGTWIFIALHDARRGPMAGGTRMKVYPDLVEGLRDAMRLAEGMTWKWAGIGLPRGGAKAVLAIPRPLADDEKEGLLLRYGDLVESLGGAFTTGADLGAGPEQMAIVARRSRHVLGVDGDGTSTDPGPFTARGVFVGLVAALGHVFGSRDLAERSVLVEGLGGVGLPLASNLAEGGARLLVADLDQAKAERFAGEVGADVVPLAEVPSTPCDVYAPCAVGATVNAETIPRLRCRLVAGSANNQLGADADAELLRARGIVYVPDWVLNAGGAIALSALKEGHDRDTAIARVDGIAATVTEILEDASARGDSTLAAAQRRIERELAASSP